MNKNASKLRTIYWSGVGCWTQSGFCGLFCADSKLAQRLDTGVITADVVTVAAALTESDTKRRKQEKTNRRADEMSSGGPPPLASDDGMD